MELIDWDNKNWKQKENGDFLFDLSNITAKTFDTTAQKWALVIANARNNPWDRSGGTKKNQVRNFYDKVLELYEKAININDAEFEEKVLPFIKMLNSKVIYASNKDNGKANKAFVIFMQEALKQINNKKSFINFKYLFEAIIGFYQEENPKKRVIFLKESAIAQKNNKGRR